jgi:AraC-like DNA-binding protein
MVSNRCKMMVRTELDKIGLKYLSIELGEIEITGSATADQISAFKKGLLKSGLELMDDKKSILIEKIKTIVVDLVHYSDDVPNKNYSEIIAKKLCQDYSTLSSLFSTVTGTTIEHYIIAHKIERVKELLLYNELNITEISYIMNYSSVAHLSAQFKKVTGLTPTYFKNLKHHKKRIALENL